MKNLTITGREIKATANHKDRTFTIRVSGAKYRTVKLSKEEFLSCCNSTANDWADFLKTDSYYLVK